MAKKKAVVMSRSEEEFRQWRELAKKRYRERTSQRKETE